MRYAEITSYPRSWDRNTHPVVGHVTILAQHLDQLERRVADQTRVRLLGHDEADDGLIMVHVACVDDAARRRFAQRWTA